MNEIEFRKRVLADPGSPDAEILDAARQNPLFQGFLDQAQQLDQNIDAIVSEPPIPADLHAKLMAIPATAESADDNVVALPVHHKSRWQGLAVAACLIVAVGTTMILNQDNLPSAADLAMGNQALGHLYHENPQLAAMNTGELEASFTLAEINSVMMQAGSELTNASLPSELPVRYANPCLIVPGYQSAHLILQSDAGPLSVMVVNNSPVEQEYRLSDDRFSGLVIPMEKGNLILISEQPEALDTYRGTLTASVGWTI